tara:strand:+ start:2586 stop:5480 length:2895 start_codon:yes stop_codon:yes gene_type:complete
MGALTGNTISSSYLGLLKTSDNAILNSSLRLIEDGGGTDASIKLSTTQLGLADGTTTVPSLTFSSDSDTGFYYSSNTIKQTIGGTTYLSLSTTELTLTGNLSVSGTFKDSSGDAGSAGQILSSTSSGTNWIDNDLGDITSVVAGDGLTGGGTSGDVTINWESTGTTGKIPKFTSTTVVGDSIVSESSSTLLIDPTGSGSHAGNIALTLLGVSGQDEQVYIYANGSSGENASIKLIPIGAGYGHIIGSGSGLRLGTSSDTDSITITSSLVEITEDVQLTGTAPNIVFNDSAVTKNIAKILGNVDSAGTNGGKLEFQTVADSGSSYITALAIDDSQQVGIGTTTPSTLLNLESSSTSALLIANRTNAVDGTKNLIDFKLDASDDNSYSAGSIGVEAEGTWSSTAGTRDGSIIFRPSVNGTDTAGMVLTSSFDLGVGLTSPSDYYATDVVISANDEGGLTFASTGTTFKQYIAWADGTSGDAQYRGYIAYDHNNDSMAIATSGSAKATIDSSGNVGIGTTSPTSHYEKVLHIHEASGSSTIHLTNNTTGSTLNDGIDILAYEDDFYLLNREHTAGKIFIGVTNDGTPTITTDHNKNVGIGTTNPSDVNALHLLSSIDSDFPTLKIETSSTTRDASLSFITNGGNTFCMGIDASDSDKFKISDNSILGTNDRLVIDSSGNLETGDITIAHDDTPTLNFKKLSSADVLGIINVYTDAGSGGKMEFKTKRNGNTALVALTIDDDQIVGIGATETYTPAPSAGGSVLNLSNTGLAIKNDTVGSDDNWSVIKNTGTGSTANLVFVTGLGTAMTMGHNGEIKIGTSTALGSGLLTVASNNNQGIAIGYGSGTNEYRRLYHHSTGLYFESSTNQAYLSAAGAWTDASDISIKKDIVEIKYGLDDVLKTKPRSYKMKSDDEVQIGFVAQEIKEIIPEVVTDVEDKPLGVSYGKLVAVAFKAIQELEARVKELENK